MPLYEYKCSECKHHFELLQSFNAEKTQACPVCGSKSDRLMSLGSFVLKGGGWYATSPKPCDDVKPANTGNCSESCDSCSLAQSGS